MISLYWIVWAVKERNPEGRTVWDTARNVAYWKCSNGKERNQEQGIELSRTSLVRMGSNGKQGSQEQRIGWEVIVL